MVKCFISFFFYFSIPAERKERFRGQWNGVEAEGGAKEPGQEKWGQWNERDSLFKTQQLQ